MSVKLLIFVFVFGSVHGQQHICAKGYNPSDYIPELRVPLSCEFEKLDCPRSWKSGIPEGSETSLPLVYHKFLTCHEGFTLCGYVPIDPKSGEVLGESGVTVGAGVDLGSKSRASFASLSSTLVDKLEPYVGLKRNLAACAAIERPLQLTQAEAILVTDAIKNITDYHVLKRYNRDKDPSALNFTSVPRGIRTAIVSVWFQFGWPPAYRTFWSFVKRNDWDNAVHELRNFYTNPNNEQPGDLRRRNDEADIIESIVAECNRSVDIVFLLDESGSVGTGDFRESLDFVKNITKAFSDENLSGDDGTRFGLSTFSDDYQPHFYLLNYTNQASYLSAIDRVSYRGGGTNLGDALQRIITDQFTEARGLRPEVDGLPRILIVLTDGQSHDSVSIPAQNVRDENIVIYAIGIASYNLDQLKNIASSESHIYILSTFSDLEKFISTITSSTCYEPRPVSLNETIITNVAKDAYQYFTYKVKPSSNLVINVTDLHGNTVVYASRTNPHPNKYDHDVAFELSGQKNKEIVISAEALVPNTRKKRSSDDLKQIYVSVTSDSDSASFVIEANECDPSNCTEGTNEIPTTTQPPTTQATSTQVFTEPVAIQPSTIQPSTIQPSTIQPSTASNTTTPTSSACVVSAPKFMAVSFVMLKILPGTFDI